MCTFHFLNLTAGVPDASWITTDYTTVENAFDTYWAALVGLYASDVKLTEYSWRADGPAFRPFGTSLSPTLRITPRSVAGSGLQRYSRADDVAGSASATSQLPPQVAVTVTETTAATFIAHDVEGIGDQTRNRWGRYYLPSTHSATSSDGRLLAASQTTIANAAEAFYETCVSAQIIPVVYSPTTGHSWSVLEVHVDDIFDVVRSRRYITPLSRAARVITQV